MIAIECPNCGTRNLTEFRFGGATRARPSASASEETWSDYIYFRDNAAGVQTEWWLHSLGCGLWFPAVRDTRTNAFTGTCVWTSDAAKGTTRDGE